MTVPKIGTRILDAVSQSNRKFLQRIGIFGEPLIHLAENLLGRDFALKAAQGAQGQIVAQVPDQRRRAGHGHVRMGHQQQSPHNSLAAVSRPAHNPALRRSGLARKEARHQPGDVSQCRSRAGIGQIDDAVSLRTFLSCYAILNAHLGFSRSRVCNRSRRGWHPGGLTLFQRV